MRLYIIAGEASGDLHGSNLIKALKSQQPDMDCRVWGGDLMAAAGGQLVKHYRDLAFMGFVEVAKNIRTILGNIAFCKKDILAFKPDAIVLIDYPGFNLRIAKWAHAQGIKVIYYISPQIWAWHKSRVFDIQKVVDLMLVILPFEKAFFANYGVEAKYVGHPLLDAIQQNELAGSADFPENTIALLPGSRKQEVQKILPRMLSVTPRFPNYKFFIAGTNTLDTAYYEPFLRNYPNVTLVQGQTYSLLKKAKAALVKSGTSTLEAALFDLPQVVCYAGNPVSYQIARRLVNIKYISLVNLVVDKPLVKELIQNELNANNIFLELSKILDPVNAAQMRQEYAAMREQLGGGGASERAAREIIAALNGTPMPPANIR